MFPKNQSVEFYRLKVLLFSKMAFLVLYRRGYLEFFLLIFPPRDLYNAGSSCIIDNYTNVG